MPLRRLIFRSFQSPGDIVMLTAAVRDLHLANPRQFETDVRTAADALWLHNPHLTRLNEGDPGVQQIDMHYPLIHECNQRPYHFIHGFAQFLEQQLAVRVPVSRFCGDIHLSVEEKQAPVPGAELGVPADDFWIVIAGGKFDFTAKWWNPESYQKVVDHFRGKIQFVQCGEAGHWHPPLDGVVNLVGKTDTRAFIRLMYSATGVLCPVTFAMHLAAAVETKPGRPPHRPCVVIAGGREPMHWEAYAQHQFLSTNGMLPCCLDGGCWKSRCQPVGDGDAKDHHDLCLAPVQIQPDLRIPRCMDLITAKQVIERIELYYQGGALRFQENADSAHSPAARENEGRGVTMPERPKISVSVHHGLGDCTYFAHLIALYVKRGYDLEVECTPDKRILFEAAGATTITSGAKASHPWGYPAGGTHTGHGHFWQGSKMGHNISEPPLPFIGDKAALWDEYCQSVVDVRPHLSAEAMQTAERWLASLPRPIVLLHTRGNTGQERKSLPDAMALEFYKSLIDRFDGTIILLDWDNRVPRLASYRIRHLDELGPCPLDNLFALMMQSDLLIGIDSGPLHVARFTQIPTVGVWMPGHYPATYTLPRRQQLNVVLAGPTREWNRFKRIPWNIVEHPGSAFDTDRLAEICVRMLGPPRYLVEQRHSTGVTLDIAADVQLQQFIREWCRGRTGNALSGFNDRHRSFDVLFTEMTRRFASPTVVETGTIRAEEDWGGAGFFTYLAGAYLSRRGGKLHSVDLSPNNCQFARTWTEVFDNTVTVHCQGSTAFLQNFSEPIDVLYLDSLDTTEPNHAEHAERELEAARPRLHGQSLIVVDDTPWHGGAWVGKGARVVPSLMNQGWKILYAGYQVVLAEGDGGSLSVATGASNAADRRACEDAEGGASRTTVGPQGLSCDSASSPDTLLCPIPEAEGRGECEPEVQCKLPIDDAVPHSAVRTVNSIFPTPCECTDPGWCARHQCHKDRTQFEYCRRLMDWFERWERGERQPFSTEGASPPPAQQSPRDKSEGKRPDRSRLKGPRLDPIVREFHRLYYERGIDADHGRGLHAETRYHGIEMHKCPLDLWIFQEILHDVRPGLIVEIGTYLGGTTLYLAHQLDLFGTGRVISIDNRDLPRPKHPRIDYLLGHSADRRVVEAVAHAATHVAPEPVIVIHDGDHRYQQVLADLEAYAPFVTPGSYLIVEDTNVNDHPVLAGWGAGPWEAVETFLERHAEFTQDRTREKFLMTYNPGGYLRKGHAESS